MSRPPSGAPAWDDRLEALTDAMLHRRAMGHDWHHAGDTVTDRRGTRILAFAREWQCQRCPVRRIDQINSAWWTVEGRRYDYPPEYRILGGVVDPSALRRSFYYRTSTLFAKAKRG